MTTFSSAIATGLAAFVVSAVVFPLIGAFRRWKAERADIPAYRDWRGRWVPDLHLIRMRRAFLLIIAAFVALGIAIDWTIMQRPLGTVTITIPKDQ